MKSQYVVNETIAAQRRILFVCEWADERQEVDLGDIGSGDTFTLTYKGQTSGAINFAADMSSAIVSALEALSNVEAGDVTVAKGTGHVYTVTLGGSLRPTGIGLLSLSPTGFTPGGVDRLNYAGSPALGLTFAAADIQISKNGATDANIAGSVTEIGYGRYYYEATLGELDTPGTLSLATTRTDIATVYPTVEVVTGILRSCLAQTGNSLTTEIMLDSAASSTANFYLPCTVEIVAGTGAGQGPRFATAYNGVSKVMSITPEWMVIPDNTSRVLVRPSIPMIAESDLLNSLGDEVDLRVPDIVSSSGVPILTDDQGRVSLAKVRSAP